MGNLIAGTTIQGRTFNDIAIQKSKEGVPRPIVYGVARPIVGNVIATTEPRIITVREEAGGKGGGTEVENQEVYRSYAIRICEGPATVRRVWRNNKLVFDARVEIPGINAEELGGVDDLGAHIAAQTANNNAFRNIATFYKGNFSQMPSPVLEAIYGIGNVPAHRGTCYMVIDNENLTDNGGAIPQYAFEVVRSEGFVLTSKPYPLDHSDSISANFKSAEEKSSALMGDSAAASFLDVSVNFVSPVMHSHEVSEGVDAGIVGITASLTDASLNVESIEEAQSLDASLVSISANLRDALIEYKEGSDEGLSVGLNNIQVSLT